MQLEKKKQELMSDEKMKEDGADDSIFGKPASKPAAKSSSPLRSSSGARSPSVDTKTAPAKNLKASQEYSSNNVKDREVRDRIREKDGSKEREKERDRDTEKEMDAEKDSTVSGGPVRTVTTSLKTITEGGR